MKDQTSSSVGRGGGDRQPGPVGDPERVAGRQRLGQAGPRQRAGGHEDVQERRRRAASRCRPPRAGPRRSRRRGADPDGGVRMVARRDRHQLALGEVDRRGRVGRLGAGLVGREPDLDEAGRPRRRVRDLGVHARPSRPTAPAPCPGTTAPSWPWSSACTSAPDSTQVTISRSVCGWSGKPCPAAAGGRRGRPSVRSRRSRGRSVPRTRTSGGCSVPPPESRNVRFPGGPRLSWRE